MVPVGDKVVAIRRSIEPSKGGIALPGGYIDMGETWQHAAVRELHEETGLIERDEIDQIDAADVELYAVETALNTNCVLIFATIDLVGLGFFEAGSPPPFRVTDETDERLLLGIEELDQIVFPTHRRIAKRWLGGD